MPQVLDYPKQVPYTSPFTNQKVTGIEVTPKVKAPVKEAIKENIVTPKVKEAVVEISVPKYESKSNY